MAKDPAFLFYSSDFLSGCIDLDMEERGQYITLLCAQHQKGHLSEKTIRLLVGSVSLCVLSKFQKDDEGLYFSPRLDDEIEKRKIFTESRKNNGSKGGRPKKETYTKPSGKPLGYPSDNLIENENENENKDVIKKGTRKKFVKPGENDVYNLMGELNMKGGNFLTEDKLINFARTFIDYYEAKGWVVGKSPMKDWQSAVRNWMRSEWDKIKNQKQNTYAKQPTTTAEHIAKAEALFRDAVAISRARDEARQDSTTP